jgi:4-carboxymuconolactone decarboxylase
LPQGDQSMNRLPPLDPETLSLRQREVYQTILNSARHSVEGPLRAWLASPEFADQAQALGQKCRFGSSLAPRLSELAILTVAAHWKSEFEWHAHAPLALQAGLSAAVVDAVRLGSAASFANRDESIVQAFAVELLTHHRVCEQTFNAARECFGDEGVVDLIGLLGYYTLIAMTIAAFEIPAAAGGPVAFED